MTDIIVPRRREDFFDKNGDPSLRFIRFLEDISSQSNSLSSTVNGNTNESSFSAINQQIKRQLDGEPEFTMDSTGFTMDSTQWSMDRVIA